MVPRSAFPAVLASSLLLLTLPGCGAEPRARAAAPAADHTVVTTGTLRPGQAIPAPTGTVVLTLRGAITRHNGPDGTLRFDMRTLERIGLAEWTGSDAVATGRTRVRFRGVLLRRLLQVAGARPGARTLRAAALNDYKVTIPIADATRLPVLLATTADGRRMSVARYGPTRVVYPFGKVPGLQPTVYDPRSIWQVASIEVR